MKRILLSFFWGWSALALCAQDYRVSTSVQPMNVLLEEFTGMYCGYCPEGHAIAHQLKRVLGDRMSVVAIHCGPFAPADNDENDLTVEDGHALGVQLGAVNGGFPSGAVNRRGWHNAGKLCYGRGYWEDFARRVVSETAPVNLWAAAEWDASTRKMKIRVEGYYTADLQGEMPRLNLHLTQSNIQKWQSGGNSGSTYPHRHVLRDVVTDVKGDALPRGKKGEYFVKEYDYQVPEGYKQIAVDPAELDLVVFVTKGYKQVLNAITVKPAYVGEVLPVKAVIRPDRIPVSGGYCYDFVEFELTNQCNSLLTSATFEVTLNQRTTQVEWKGAVPAFATETIRIPVDWNRKAEKSNDYTVALKALNGVSFRGNAFSGSFQSPATLPEQVVLRINTDEFAGENTFRLCDMTGEVLKTFGPFEQGRLNHYEERLNLSPDTRYCLEITDSWGNGIYPHGNVVELVSESGMALLQQYAVKGFGTRLFFQTGVPSGIAEVPEVAVGAAFEVYNLLGKWVMRTSNLKELPKGVYIIRSGNQVKKVMRY